MKEREDMMRSKFDRDHDNILRDRRGFDPRTVSTDGQIPEDALHHFQRHSAEDLHRVHKDISDRHQELIDHRKKVIITLFIYLFIYIYFITLLFIESSSSSSDYYVIGSY